MSRDRLFGPAWRSAVVADTRPEDGVYVGADLNGWKYYRVGKKLVAVPNPHFKAGSEG